MPCVIFCKQCHLLSWLFQGCVLDVVNLDTCLATVHMVEQSKVGQPTSKLCVLDVARKPVHVLAKGIILGRHEAVSSCSSLILLNVLCLLDEKVADTTQVPLHLTGFRVGMSWAF